MTIAVLPRATASAIINRAISRGIWVVGLIVLVLDLPGLLDVFWRRGLEEHLATPLMALLVMICALIVAARHPASWVVALYLLVGGVCAIVYQLGILTADPSLASDATYLVNRPAVAIVLVGTLSSSTVVGILWCLLGYAVSITPPETQTAGALGLPG